MIMKFNLFALISVVSWLVAQTIPDANSRMLIGWLGGVAATWCYALLEYREHKKR